VPTLKDLGYNAANIIPLGFACRRRAEGHPDRLEAMIAIAGRDPELADTCASSTSCRSR